MALLHNKKGGDIFVKSITSGGTPEHMGGYIVAATISFATNVISDSGSGFLTKNFQNGDSITVSGSTSNDGTYTVVTVAAGTLTLGSGVVLTTEAAGATVTITETMRTGNRQEVPDGVALTIKAHQDNTGVLYYAFSSTDIATSYKRDALYPSQIAKWQIMNLRTIWFDGTTNDQIVCGWEK